MEYSEILDLAIQRCERTYKYDYNFFYKIYPFTTENISGYINNFDFNNKSLLTVGSSCDQILNAILLGCKDISLVDINPFCKFYYYLKVAAIIGLDYDEFLLFFRYIDYPKVFNNNIDAFNINLFNRIKDTLRIIDFQSYMFWDDLFQMFSPLYVRQIMFSNDEYRNSMLARCNPYLCNTNTYMILRNKIKKINPKFINGNIDTINLDRCYDNIWLSNILTDWYSTKSIKEIFLRYEKLLNNNGKILISYLYDTTINTKYIDKWADIYNLEEIFNIFNKYDLKLLTFVGVDGLKWQDDDYKKDSILMYTKKK